MNREEIAQQEVGRTEISPSCARALIALFLLTLVAVPVVQLLVWVAEGFAAAPTSQFPMIRSLTLPVEAVNTINDASGSALTKLKAGNRAMLQSIDDIEDDLVDQSVVGDIVRPRIQGILASLGWGNEQVRIGRRGWLFFEPAVQYLTGDGFLDAEYQTKRVRATDSWLNPPSTDPLPAILDFAAQLRARGIDLVLLPVPVKAGVMPDTLSGRLQRGKVLHNQSWGEFLGRLESGDLRVEHVDGALENLKNPYLKTDSHWAWHTVDTVARQLAENLRTSGVTPTCTLTQKTATVSNRGDLAQMLPLLDPSRFPEETAKFHAVVESGPDECPDRSEVLLLGDSFSNIYSDDSLGWGSRAGLAERLAWHLQAPVESIVRNNDGAFATRLELARRLTKNPNYLNGFTHVIWEFTERELSFGDWRHIVLYQSAGDSDTFVTVTPGETRRIQGVIAAMGEVPIPDEAAYPDYLIGLHLIDVKPSEGTSGTEALVFVWAMRNYELTTGAHLHLNDRVTMVVQDWSEVSADLDTITRGEIFDERLLTQNPCWGEVIAE